MKSRSTYNILHSLCSRAKSICASSLLVVKIQVNVPLTSRLSCINANKVFELEKYHTSNQCTFSLTITKLSLNHPLFCWNVHLENQSVSLR